jgi:hypothetical protein
MAPPFSRFTETAGECKYPLRTHLCTSATRAQLAYGLANPSAAYCQDNGQVSRPALIYQLQCRSCVRLDTTVSGTMPAMVSVTSSVMASVSETSAPRIDVAEAAGLARCLGIGRECPKDRRRECACDYAQDRTGQHPSHRVTP